MLAALRRRQGHHVGQDGVVWTWCCYVSPEGESTNQTQGWFFPAGRGLKGMPLQRANIDRPTFQRRCILLFIYLFSYLFFAFRFWLLASWLLGFSASCWFMRLLVAFWLWLFAVSAFPVPLRQVAFWLLRLFAGLCGCCKLWLLAFAPFHCFLDLASHIISITSSSLFESLLRTSSGASPPLNPLLLQ